MRVAPGGSSDSGQMSMTGDIRFKSDSCGRNYRHWSRRRLCSVPVVTRDKRLVLIAAIMGTAVVSVDSTVVNVALPAIRDDLGGGLAGQQWISNAYLLTLSSLILVAGSLGRPLRREAHLRLGVAGFGVASVLCALAPSIELLVGARALQGIVRALLTPAGLAVIATTFPPEERGRAVGLWTAWGGIGIVAGPADRRPACRHRVLALDLRDQRAARIATLCAGRPRRAGEPPSQRREARPDRRGAVRAGLAGFTFGLIEQPMHGWGSRASSAGR